MKVWMRGMRACFTASAQRSMSLTTPRDRPATEAFFTRLAISRDGFEIALRGHGKAGLDDVDAQRVQNVGDFQLFLEIHRGAGAIARRRAGWCRR